MKTTVKIEQEVDIKYVELNVAVRYDEEDMPKDFFGRKGDMWAVVINIDEGRVVNWPEGLTLDLHMKVCDQGSYYLQDEFLTTIAAIEGDYVPNGLIPGEFGDYIIMDIGPDGKINNWPERPSFEQFFPE